MQELKGFGKVMLAPGETQRLELRLTKVDLAYYDDLRGRWVAEAGVFQVRVGASSRNIRACATFSLSATATFGGPRRSRARLGLDAPLVQLLADEGARAILQQGMPGLSSPAQLGMAADFSLRQLARMMPDLLTPAALAALEAALAALPN